MTMRTVLITLAEFQEFCELQLKHRWDWPATFSTNNKGEVWPFLCNGYTPITERTDVRECSPLLAQVADVYTAQREDGGRFFIDQNGAFWKNELGEPVQFVKWNAGTERLVSPQQAKSEELSRSFLLAPEQYAELKKRAQKKRARS